MKKTSETQGTKKEVKREQIERGAQGLYKGEREPRFVEQSVQTQNDSGF
jgi:hypothetical protein